MVTLLNVAKAIVAILYNFLVLVLLKNGFVDFYKQEISYETFFSRLALVNFPLYIINYIFVQTEPNPSPFTALV